MAGNFDPFGARASLQLADGSRVAYYQLEALKQRGVGDLGRLPYTVRVLLENVLRLCDGSLVKEDDVLALARWQPGNQDFPFLPARVLLQDFTGVPCVVDLAAMRSAVGRMGGDPQRINPLVPVDLVIDHSVQVDQFGSDAAFAANVELEYARNKERYALLRWAQTAFKNFRAVPPDTGIVHQVNLEFLAHVVVERKEDDGTPIAFPDTLVGTDSHTTMINGLGVLGWGVGGIEAEAVMLGQPLYLLLPTVVGMRFTGKLKEGVTGTDLVLTVTQRLRAHGVVGKFVEFFGPGVSALPLAQRATIANMSPEYGATAGLFPVDDETLRYLRNTARPDRVVDLVERYTKAQGLFRTDTAPEPQYSELLELDLSTVEPSLAGPKRPQDRVAMRELKESFRAAYPGLMEGNGAAATDGHAGPGHGSVAIAAITSCTNTSNPALLVGAGLLARNAVQKGLSVKPWVKTSLAPGSRAVTDYLHDAGLLSFLEQLKFNLVGYGCTTCIGNSGPLPDEVASTITDQNLTVAAVLSGNRNFEGRIHPQVKANYLASPPLVVAYALAGTVDIDLDREPLGTDKSGAAVYLRDIWPSDREVADEIEKSVRPQLFARSYGDVFTGDERWRSLPVPTGDLYDWDAESTYVQEPPFFTDLAAEPGPLSDVHGARVLAMLADSVTTDHISPAGNIPRTSPAGQYLIAHDVRPDEFNSYGSRRGNDRVMVRGTFGNIRLRNELSPGKEGDWTVHLPDGEEMRIFQAAERYREEGVPLLVIAGKEYGTGSSRDWAAKGTLLLGVKAVIAESFERIHRSNLVGMGVLPLQFVNGQTRETLGLTGREVFDIDGIADNLTPGKLLSVRALKEDGTESRFSAQVRIDSPVEVDYHRHGGILQYVLRRLASEHVQTHGATAG
ncbi:MAG TPA: aconitate hydratase AcnA [Dehalococcoidia bacterium]|nr:aconitate hydratase AcnA [Dehalococcoidia bacterium]